MKLFRPGMGTENSLNVIAALIQMKRPTTVLEIGAGDSTVAIARALVRAKRERLEDQALVESEGWSERAELLIPRETQKEYDPVFISIDSFSAKGCSADEAWRALAGYVNEGLRAKTMNCDFFALPDSFFSETGILDFVWIDAGTFTDDVRFIGRLWPLLAPGGVMTIHEPYFTAPVEQGADHHLAMVRTPLWEAIVKNIGDGIDILSIPETHKYRQTGLGILRKHEGWERPRSAGFQTEMMFISEPPARFSKAGIRNDKMEKLRGSIKKIGLLKQQHVRKVLYAIGLGNATIEEISRQLAIEFKDIASICSKLLGAGLIENKDGRFCERDRFWYELPDDPHRKDTEMSDITLEKPEILDLIVSHLERGRKYSEAEISNYCQVFTDDFARLRRKLVDTKRLTRDSNLYRVTL